MAAPLPKPLKKTSKPLISQQAATQENSINLKNEETFEERAKKVTNNGDRSFDFTEDDKIAFNSLMQANKRPKFEKRQDSLIHQIKPSDTTIEKLLSLKNKTKKRSWNTEEDQKLIELVQIHGP